MISEITNQVFIGDSDDARRADNKRFDAVLNVAIDFDWRDGFKYRHKVGLFDGPGNHPATFFAAVVLLDALVKSGKKVLVHCGAGMSRSVMVVATWLTVQDPKSDLDGHLNNVMMARKMDNYRPELYALASFTIGTWKRLC
jgi:protein-tyrosine phosphatase